MIKTNRVEIEAQISKANGNAIENAKAHYNA